MTEATAESLLAEAQALYQQTEADYRDRQLVVGRLLHQFVFTSLQATDGRWRQHRPVTREGLMAEAAKRLDVRLHRITELIIPAMTVDLLSDSGNFGKLGIQSLMRLSVLIHRPQRGTETTQASLYETWAIKPGYEVSGPDLFQRAAFEGWGRERVSKELAEMLGIKATPRQRLHSTNATVKRIVAANEGSSDDFETTPIRISALAKAAPGDVAEQCLKIVLANDDPWQVAQRLIVELQKIPRKKRDASLYEVAV